MAFPNRLATRVGKGEFRTVASRDKPHVVLAINLQSSLGGLAYSDPDSNEPLKIALEPLVRVFGEIRSGGRIPEWTYACIFPGTLKKVPD